VVCIKFIIKIYLTLYSNVKYINMGNIKSKKHIALSLYYIEKTNGNHYLEVYLTYSMRKYLQYQGRFIASNDFKIYGKNDCWSAYSMSVSGNAIFINLQARRIHINLSKRANKDIIIEAFKEFCKYTINLYHH